MDTANRVAMPVDHLSSEHLAIQEVHHRISNSLQLISGILQCQASRSNVSEVRQTLGEALGRIGVIASALRRQHKGDPTEKIGAGQYLQDLIGSMENSILDRAERSIQLDIPTPIRLSHENLEHVGLIVNELVTNALKYGHGHVVIRIRETAQGLEIIAEDEGKGFRADFDPASNGGFGMRLLKALAHGSPMPIVVDRTVAFTRIVVKFVFQSI